MKDNFITSFSSFRKKGRGQGAAAFAAGLAAELVITWDGAVPRQHLHLTEYGFISQTRLIVTGRQLTGSGGLRLVPFAVVSGPAEHLPHLRPFTAGHGALTPGPRFPLGWAGHSVTRPAALGSVAHTVLAVHRAVGAVMEGLEAAHGAKLVAGTPTSFGAMLPLFRYPEWMCTLLNIAHSSNRFWLFVDFTEAAMNHFIVTFPTASIFSVLETSTTGFGTLRPAL